MKTLLRTAIVTLAICASASAALADDFKLHRYAAEKWNTNSYWLESDSGIVLIDGLLLMRDATLLATMIGSTGKPVAGAIITHEHTDHAGGLNTLMKKLGRFPIITTQSVADHLASSHKTLKGWMGKDVGDYDPIPPKATQIVDDGAVLTLAGIKLVIDDIGPGEGEANLLVHVPEANILFSGDATNHGHHVAGLRSGRSHLLLAQRKYIKDTYGSVEMIYPGHGLPARPAAVLDVEIDYITFRHNLVREALKSKSNMSEDGKNLRKAVLEQLTAQVMDRYPHLADYGFNPAQIVRGSWPALVKEMLEKK